MVTALQIAGIGITAVLLAKMLERYAAEQAMLLTLLVGTLLTGAAVLAMTPVLVQIDALLADCGLDTEHTASAASRSLQRMSARMPENPQWQLQSC